MQIDLINNNQIFLYAIIFGLLLGAFYDIFRISRIAINFNFWQIFFQDLIYFIICSIGTFIFSLTFTFGRVRFYTLAGQIIGWCVYHITIGEIIISLSNLIITIIKKIFRYLAHFISKPFLFLFNKFFKCLFDIKMKFDIKIKKMYNKLKFSLNSKANMLYNLFIRKNPR